MTSDPNIKSETAKPGILMLNTEYHPVFSGHAIYLRRLMGHIQRKGYRVSVLTGDFGKLPAEDKLDGIDIHRFSYDPHEKGREIKMSLRIISFLFRKRKTYDILHFHGHLDYYGLITLFCKVFRKKIIMHMVLLGSDDPLTLLQTYKIMKIRLKLLSLIDRFICISRILGESYLKAGMPPQKLVYIPQGVDMGIFNPSLNGEKLRIKRKIGLDGYDKIILFVGAVIERKGVDQLVNAWSGVFHELPKSALVIVGPYQFGNEDQNSALLNRFVDRLHEQIKSSHAPVLFAGESACVHEYMKAADFLVLPSKKEGFGNVIIEAMASGLPCVVTPMDGVADETIEQGVNGFIVNNEGELTGAIRKLMVDNGLRDRMGKNALKIARERFDMELIAGHFADVYESLTRA